MNDLIKLVIVNTDCNKLCALSYTKHIDDAPIIVKMSYGNEVDAALIKLLEYNYKISMDNVLIEDLCKLDYYEELPLKLYTPVIKIIKQENGGGLN